MPGPSSDEVEKRGFEGIDTRRDPVRNYPAKDVAANILGFLGTDGEPLQGFERVFNHTLSGKDGSATYETGGGQRLPLGDNSVVEPVNGSDVDLDDRP